MYPFRRVGRSGTGNTFLSRAKSCPGACISTGTQSGPVKTVWGQARLGRSLLSLGAKRSCRGAPPETSQHYICIQSPIIRVLSPIICMKTPIIRMLSPIHPATYQGREAQQPRRTSVGFTHPMCPTWDDCVCGLKKALGMSVYAG